MEPSRPTSDGSWTSSRCAIGPRRSSSLTKRASSAPATPHHGT